MYELPQNIHAFRCGAVSKVIISFFATKSPSHEVSQSIQYQVFKFRDSLCFCVFVAKM
jgi:hypothetical protein